jgi:hypothetical protein
MVIESLVEEDIHVVLSRGPTIAGEDEEQMKREKAP